jgi:hypothetical protein
MAEGPSEHARHEDFAIHRQQSAGFRVRPRLIKVAAQLGLKIILVGLGIVCEFFAVEYR